MPTPNATKTLLPGTSTWKEVPGFTFAAIEGPEAGRTWKSTTDRCGIGTHDSNELRLNDPAVSRFHCEVWVSDGSSRVRDRESKNGTVVDGVRICDGYLRSGSILRVGQSALRFEVTQATCPVAISLKTEFGLLVGSSLAMRTIYPLLEYAAASDLTVLFEGETGTGKGVAAESVHQVSARRSGPFVVADCGAIPANLLESELFGHERGAFTGAIGRRVGMFEEAAGGTVFLDEIGELPQELQSKLLRVLDDRQIRRVGGNVVQRVDVRVIAATNRDLRAEVNAGRFRSDLYYRLAVLRIRMPALREHPEDIPLLVNRILVASRGSNNASAAAFRSQEFIAGLQRASWQGNVRELRNHIERCLVFQQALPHSEVIAMPEVPTVTSPSLGYDPQVPYHPARLTALFAWEGQYLRAVMHEYNNSVEQAAKAVGIGRAYMYRLLSRHGLRRER